MWYTRLYCLSEMDPGHDLVNQRSYLIRCLRPTCHLLWMFRLEMKDKGNIQLDSRSSLVCLLTDGTGSGTIGMSQS